MEVTSVLDLALGIYILDVLADIVGSDRLAVELVLLIEPDGAEDLEEMTSALLGKHIAVSFPCDLPIGFESSQEFDRDGDPTDLRQEVIVLFSQTSS